MRTRIKRHLEDDQSTLSLDSEEERAEVQEALRESERDVFFKACCEGDLATVRQLLFEDIELGVAVNTAGLAGIHLAASYGNVDIVTFLSAQFPKLYKLENASGLVAIDLSIINNRVECTKFFLEKDFYHSLHRLSRVLEKNCTNPEWAINLMRFSGYLREHSEAIVEKYNRETGLNIGVFICAQKELHLTALMSSAFIEISQERYSRIDWSKLNQSLVTAMTKRSSQNGKYEENIKSVLNKWSEALMNSESEVRIQVTHGGGLF